MAADPDQALIAATLKGDQKAFKTLVERYERYAFNLAFRIMKVREEAEEVAQDAFVKAYRSLDKFRGDSKFVSWLYTIIYREAIDRLRRKDPMRVELEAEPAAEHWESPEDTGLDLLQQEERSALIRRALDSLRPAEAAVLTLFYLDEQSLRETADITGMTESNVKVVLFRGRKNLLEAIQQIRKTELNELL